MRDMGASRVRIPFSIATIQGTWIPRTVVSKDIPINKVHHLFRTQDSRLGINIEDVKKRATAQDPLSLSERYSHRNNLESQSLQTLCALVTSRSSETLGWE